MVEAGKLSLDDDVNSSLKSWKLPENEFTADSANTWDSLALAYQQAGNKGKAIEHYRNALKRDPKFASALKALTELNKNNPE